MTEVSFDSDERRGLTATVERDHRTWTVSLLDVEIPDKHQPFSRLVGAYRRWLGVGLQWSRLVPSLLDRRM